MTAIGEDTVTGERGFEQVVLAGVLARVFRAGLKVLEVHHLAWLLSRVSTQVRDSGGDELEIALTERQVAELLGWLYPGFRRGPGDDAAIELLELLRHVDENALDGAVLGELVQALQDDAVVVGLTIPEGVKRRWDGA